MWDDGELSGRGGRKGGGADRAAVVEKARGEREARKILKEQKAQAVKVQSLARGWLTWRKERERLRKELENKQRDVVKVQKMVEESYGTRFVLPKETWMQLVQLLCFVYNKDRDDVPLAFLATHACSGIESDPGLLNLKGDEHSHRLQTFFKICARRAFGKLETGKRRSFSSISVVDHACIKFVSTLLTKADVPTQRQAVHLFLSETVNLVDEFMASMDSFGLPTEDFTYSEDLRKHTTKLLHLVMSLVDHEQAMQLTNVNVELLKILSIPLAPQRFLSVADELVACRHFASSLTTNLRPKIHQSSSVPVAAWQLGNLLEILANTPIGTLEEDVMLAILAKLGNLLLEVPETTYNGNMTVLRLDRDTCVALPDLLRQQLTILSHLELAQGLVSRCLIVDEEFLAERRRADDSAWEAKEKLLANKASTDPSLKGPASKGMLEKVKDTVSSWSRFLGRRKTAPPADTSPALRNVSNTSRQLASGEGVVLARADSHSSSAKGSKTNHPFDIAKVKLCTRLYALALCRWPHSTSNPTSLAILNAVSFSSPALCNWLWTAYCTSTHNGKQHEQLALDEVEEGFQAILFLFCSVMHHVLLITDDEEFYDIKEPLHLNQVERVVVLLKQLLFKTIVKLKPSQQQNHQNQLSQGLSAELASRSSQLLSLLYERHSRRAIVPTKLWLIPQLNFKNGIANLGSSVSEEAKHRLVKEMPYGIPFAERVRMFQDIVAQDREVHQANRDSVYRFQVRRSTIFEDGFGHLSRPGLDLKRRLYVVFINAAGREETGIDAGGLFKEFWTSLSAVAFDQQYGLFHETSDHLLYPNPQSQVAHGPDHLALFEFLGSIVGKAMYEGIVIQPRFARFFLSKFLGRYSFIGDLPSLDLELYKNLMFLKTYDGDIRDLCLTFAVSEEQFGEQRQVELVPGGASIDVHAQNKFRYVNLVADYHLNRKGSAQTNAFMRGFFKIIHPEWVRMFTQPELQTLISGSDLAFDVSDLRRNTVYANGFFAMDRTVSRFWKVVEELSDEDKSLLLKFVTSCERPPLLGFKTLHPPFCLHRISISSDEERLVTASTCFNTLKLPTYSSAKVLKEKLLLSIRSGAGFEMS